MTLYNNFKDTPRLKKKRKHSNKMPKREYKKTPKSRNNQASNDVDVDTDNGNSQTNGHGNGEHGEEDEDKVNFY